MRSVIRKLARQNLKIHSATGIGYLPLILALSACSFSHASSELPPPAVKRAWVTGFVSPDTPKDALPPCLRILPEDDFREKRFIKLYYRHVRITINEVAELPPDMDVSPGDMIAVIPHDCDSGHLSLITKKLQ